VDEIYKTPEAGNLPQYSPDEETSKVIKAAKHRFHLARKSKEPALKLWREAEELYGGQHWSGFNMPNYKNQLTLDLIASAIDTMVPILSTRPPKIDVIAYGESEEDRLIAETMQGVMDELWTVRDMTSVMPEWLLDFLVYGTGIVKVHFRNEDDMPDCDVVDPYAFYVNPSATKLENAEYVIYAAPTPLYKIREMYENGKFVAPEGNLEEFEALKTYQDPNASSQDRKAKLKSNTGGHFVVDDNNDAYKELEPRALLIECFMRDPKAPNKMRMTTIANNVLLYDGDYKYPFFNRDNGIPHPFPFVHLKNNGSAHSFWGKPEPKRLKSINLAMDKITSQVLDSISLTANPMWVVDETSQVTDQITNRPGSIIRKKGPGQVTMQSPGSVPGYVFNFYQQMMDAFEIVSGINPSSQGRADTNVTSGVQAQIMKQAASTKIEFKSRVVDQGMQTLGQMWLMMFLNLGTKIHWVSVTDPDGVSEMRDVIGSAFKDRKMAVRAKAGSMLPENRQFLENKILQLAQMGMLTDQEYILEHMELPGKERLLRKLKEQKEAQAQAMQQQQGMADMGDNPQSIFESLQQNPELAQAMQGQLGEEVN
tara:strand:+ start:19359 stop:21143 length:1785 start_codon:yes stop_codon:yes gene_type:complete